MTELRVFPGAVSTMADEAAFRTATGRYRREKARQARRTSDFRKSDMEAALKVIVDRLEGLPGDIAQHLKQPRCGAEDPSGGTSADTPKPSFGRGQGKKRKPGR